MQRFGRAGIVAMGLALLQGCNTGTSVSQDYDRAAAADKQVITAEVKAAIKTQLDGYAAHDPAKAASIAADDMLGMFHGEPNVQGHDAVLAQITAQMADPALKLTVSDETVDVAASGDMAIYHATYRFTFTNPETKQPAVETGNWVAVFTRQPDGKMKMHKDMVLDLPA